MEVCLPLSHTQSPQTNLPQAIHALSAYHPISQMFGKLLRNKGLTMIALQLMGCELRLNFESVTGSAKEWDDWRDNLINLVTSPRTEETFPDLLKKIMESLVWFVRHLKEVRVTPDLSNLRLV